MLAPAQIPKRYDRWNQKWGAPYGHIWRKWIPKKYRTHRWGANLCGPFAFQTNNDTRAFEYPWAYQSLGLKPGMRVLEIGGGHSGLQFVISLSGCEVTNIDPGLQARGRGWGVSNHFFDQCNLAFGTRVQLKNCFVEEAALPSASFDRVLSVSVIEHIPESDIETLLDEVHRVLKPGGLFVVTLDLFLNIQPFAPAERNLYGKNISTRWLVERTGMQLVHGNPAELLGYDQFDTQRVRRELDSYLVGQRYPTLVQTLVLQKSAAECN